MSGLTRQGVQVANNTAIIAKRYTYVNGEIRLKTRGLESGYTRGPLSSKGTKGSKKKTNNEEAQASENVANTFSTRMRARAFTEARLRVFARVIKRQNTVQWRT